MTHSIETKNVLVVGGGSGIGLGIAQAFDGERAHVAIAGRRQDKLDAAIEGTMMIAKTCDATDRAQVNDLLAWFENEVGALDILVYCAGINVAKRKFEDMDPGDFDKVISTNLTGAFNCIHGALEIMRKRKDGIIFNVTSLSGVQTVDIAGVQYSVAKTAQNVLGIFANLEGLPDGVRLTNVIPGEVNTAMLDQRPLPPTQEQRDRMVHPDDIAAMMLAVARLPKRAVVPELIVTPAHQPRI